MSSLIVEVCEIKNIEKHPNADRLDIATVKGWNCIVERDTYKIGDWCLFFPPDCILPDWIIEEYQLEFLKKGGRVGTLKLRGYISQGLILPVSGFAPSGLELGDNLAEELGIKKYEVPERVTAKSGNITSKKTQNPHFSKYTDIENIQNFDTVFQDGDMVVITEKIHGSNIRFGWLPIEINFKSRNWLGILRSLFKKYILREKYEFVYGSHNVQLQFDSDKGYYDKNIYSEVLKKYNIGKIPAGVIVYGEVYGKGVQELEYGLDGLELAVFDVKLIEEGYLSWRMVQAFCSAWDLPIVPELYTGKYHDGILKEFTEGNSELCTSQIREGCVIKSLVEVNHPRIGRKILKSINPEYLARKNRTEFH